MKDFTEMGDFVFFYECVIKWALLTQEVKEGFEESRAQKRPSRLSYINGLTQVIAKVQDACSIEDIFPVELIPKISVVSIPSDQCDNINSSPSSENPGYNNFTNNSELIKVIQKLIKCYNQNSTLDNLNVDILESENQIVKGLI
ncbi:10803_t:CDS:2 [Funneliformis mosseae]|uniref:10803_t:CDS:1 n=1 Tax=Funneliformis mosseae TaxID=27381 RepID=A0A9N9DNC5_FUNMO|nr:10803_t:CDS:2 [Funneliformis mosseae]